MRIVVKLMSLFPPRQDAKFTVEAYVQELEGVPCFWLRRAARALADDPNREWLPRTGHIKDEAAKQFHEWRNRQAHGLPYDPSSRSRRLSAGRELHLMRKGPVPVSHQLSAGDQSE